MKFLFYPCMLILLFTSITGTSQIITTVAGDNIAGYTGNGGPATLASLHQPNQLTVDGAGNLYIADAGNNVVRKVSPDGIITVVAGTHIGGYSGDGGAATSANLYIPLCVRFDGAGNLYITTQGDNRVRKVDPSGVISTVAGNGTPGFTGDGGPATAASLDGPFSIAFDAAGNMYIADLYSNHIRKVDVSGTISTIAGTGAAAFTGDGGPATAATMNGPIDVAFDKDGNLYIADISNSAIRKINTSGIISTIAGNGYPGYDGDGDPAIDGVLQYPYALCLDTANNIYITDNGNACIRKIDASGNIETIAGSHTVGYSGDGGPATDAQFNNPGGVVADVHGNIFIADYGNNVVRKVYDAPLVSKVASETINANYINVYPNPANDLINIDIKNPNNDEVSVQLSDITGKVLQQKEVNHNARYSTSFDISALPSGTYLVTATADLSHYETKIAKE